MFRATLDHLACPCQGRLTLLSENAEIKSIAPVSAIGTVAMASTDAGEDILYGTLQCESCKERFPILQGVAIIVPDVREYLLHHAKGVSKSVPEERIPKSYRREYRACLEELRTLEKEHIEEDLESERVNSLYLMNHYMSAAEMQNVVEKSPLLMEWIKRYWDQGPMKVIAEWIPEKASILELGCGVGGLYRRLNQRALWVSPRYLGMDSSFHSVLIARHLNFGGPFIGKLAHPTDLLFGNSSREFPKAVFPKMHAGDRPDAGDFVVAEIDAIPAKKGSFDVSVSLNAIDMLEDPETLVRTQSHSVRPGGEIIQSGPYIWHERISKKLKSRLPKGVEDSAAAVEWLYSRNGFEITQRELHVPWLFFKHLRQIELYSVHAFRARKNS